MKKILYLPIVISCLSLLLLNSSPLFANEENSEGYHPEFQEKMEQYEDSQPKTDEYQVYMNAVAENQQSAEERTQQEFDEVNKAIKENQESRSQNWFLYHSIPPQYAGLFIQQKSISETYQYTFKICTSTTS